MTLVEQLLKAEKHLKEFLKAQEFIRQILKEAPQKKE